MLPFLAQWSVGRDTPQHCAGLSRDDALTPLRLRVAKRGNPSSGSLDADEGAELLETLNSFSNRDFELGEVLKSTTLPLSDPAPELTFADRIYCFTGTFSYGQRKHCEKAVVDRGGSCAGLSQKTNVLVIGVYATESWKHSSFGNKILKASEWRDAGLPIAIVSEKHWVRYL
jgi:NAD-dependent DNA ligase